MAWLPAGFLPSLITSQALLLVYEFGATAINNYNYHDLIAKYSDPQLLGYLYRHK